MNIIIIANILQLYKRRPNKPCVIERKWRLCNVLQEENIVTPWWRAESEISAAGFVSSEKYLYWKGCKWYFSPEFFNYRPQNVL